MHIVVIGGNPQHPMLRCEECNLYREENYADRRIKLRWPNKHLRLRLASKQAAAINDSQQPHLVRDGVEFAPNAGNRHQSSF